MEIPWVRKGSCDACVGRHDSAWCCTTIDAGQVFGRLNDASVHLLRIPSPMKRLSFGVKMELDAVRFYRLHGLDNTRTIWLAGDKGGGILVRVSLGSRRLTMRSVDARPFAFNVDHGDDLQLVIQLPCSAYDLETRRCHVYEKRPRICKDFPVNPGQIQNTPCAFRFVPMVQDVVLRAPDGREIPLKPMEG